VKLPHSAAVKKARTHCMLSAGSEISYHTKNFVSRLFSHFQILIYACVKFFSLALVKVSLIFETLSKLGSIRKLNRFSAGHRVTQYIIQKYFFYLASTAAERCWIIKQYNIAKVIIHQRMHK